MIAQQHHIGNLQFIEYVALPQKLLSNPEVGDISSMQHKVDIVATVEMRDKSLGLVVPSLSIADKRKPETALSVQSLLDTGHIAGIDAGIAVTRASYGLLSNKLHDVIVSSRSNQTTLRAISELNTLSSYGPKVYLFTPPARAGF